MKDLQKAALILGVVTAVVQLITAIKELEKA